MKTIIITADDLGISPEINKGIVEAHTDGILKTTALLMNAPFTNEGISVAKDNPNLEVGLHLSIVEGLSLTGIESGVTDELKYFNHSLCLHRDWKHFLLHFAKGNIRKDELYQELDMQFALFLDHFKTIPFVNGTQHMHLIPGVWTTVKELCIKYKVKGVRLPGLTWPNQLWFNKRLPFILPFQFLGDLNRATLKRTHIVSPDYVEGLQFSGKINSAQLMRILKHISTKGVSEIVMHPGYSSKTLRNDLPWAYTNFNWEWELNALKSDTVKAFINQHNIQVIKYSDLS